MLFASLILSATFASSMFALTKASKVEGESSPSSVKQPEIHIHNNNNSHGGYSSSNSHGGSATNNISANEDSVSEDIIKQEIDRLRMEFMKKQELDMRTLQELDRVSELLNKRK